MAVNIKDLYGNPGDRFKKISFCRNSQSLLYVHGVFLLAVWLFSRSDAILAISFILDLPRRSGMKEIAKIASNRENNHTESKNTPYK